MSVRKLKDGKTIQKAYIPKLSIMTTINTKENIFKLIDNPFLEMRDVKCEFH